MPENEKINTQERMARISLSVAESVWCYYNEYRFHDDAVDSKTINEAYANIRRKREEIKIKCQKIYDAESYDYIVTNFGIIEPFVKRFFCKEEGIVLALEDRNISFIDFMGMRIKNSSLDEKQLLESFSSSIVPAEPCVVAATSKTTVLDVPAKLAEVLPATNTSPVTTTAQPESTVVPAKNKEQEKLALSDFPLTQAKKAEAHDKKQESEGPWLLAPTRKKPVLRAPESRPNTFLSAWEDTCAKGALKKVVPLAPQVAENRNTVPPKDEHHFPALCQTKPSRKLSIKIPAKDGLN